VTSSAGDADGDLVVTPADAYAVLNHLAGNDSVTSYCASDVDCDLTLTPADGAWREVSFARFAPGK